MDIHKPKPWHAWREFLKEYAIIVVGVLTALAAEQAVQAAHQRNMSAEAREAVRAEINLDLANFKRRDDYQSCINGRLTQIGALLDQADAGEPFEPPLGIGGPVRALLYTERWEVATAGGRTSLLSLQEQGDFARVYEALRRVYDSEGAEVEAWGRLLALENARNPSAEVLARAREALGLARMANYQTRSMRRLAVGLAQRIGIRGDSPEVLNLVTRSAIITQLCAPMTTPPAQVLAASKDALGLP